MKRYEILPGLPPYGPMYINIPERTYSSEGVAIRFFKTDGTNWVGNFANGLNGVTEAYDFPERDRVLILVNGEAYIINPDIEKELDTFGGRIDQVFTVSNGNLVLSTGTEILILDRGTWELWLSPRISWDGFKDLKLEDDVLSGMSFNAVTSIEPWTKFTVNIKSHKITGNSYAEWWGPETAEKRRLK